MLAPWHSLVVASVVAAATLLSCGRLAVKRKDDGKKSEPAETDAATPPPGDVTTDPCATAPRDDAACAKAMTQSIAVVREQLGAVVAAFAPKSLAVPDPKMAEILAALDEVVAKGASGSFASSEAWKILTPAGAVVRERDLVRVSTAVARFTLTLVTSEGWTAESLVTGTDCAASLVRVTKTLAVHQGKIMLRDGCDSFVYTDFVGDDRATTASSLRLGLEDDPKTATAPALEGNPYCARPGEAPVFGKACTSTVAAILVGAYGDPALWVSPKELSDLKTQVEPVP